MVFYYLYIDRNQKKLNALIFGGKVGLSPTGIHAGEFAGVFHWLTPQDVA
jgi:hypothetical protein